MSTTATIHRDLLIFFSGMPVWQNEAFRRILAKAKLDAVDIHDLTTLALVETGLETSASAMPSKLSDTELPTAPAATGSTPPKLTGLHTLVNVNRLATGQTLKFGKNLTIIYGGNGAGKSGYARVLKKACRCHERAIEPVLKNVYEAAATGSPRAKLDFEDSGTTETIDWAEGVRADERLRHFAVFDSKAARLFISDKNDVPAPTIFAKLETLGEVINQVKDRIATLATKEIPPPAALNHLVDDTPTGQRIKGITANTLAADLESALVWTPDNETKVAELESQLSTLKASGPQALRKQLQQRHARIQTLKSTLASAESALAPEKVEEIQNLVRRCDELRRAKRLVAEQALGQSTLPGAGTPIWEDLLKTAAEFYATHAENDIAFPGVEGQSWCVLCQQKLDTKSHLRIESFWRFIQDTASVDLANSEKRLKQCVEKIRHLETGMPEAIKDLSGQFLEDVPGLWHEIPGAFIQYAEIAKGLRSMAEVGIVTTVPNAPSQISVACNDAMTAISVQETQLEDPAKAAGLLTQMTTSLKSLLSLKSATAERATILAYREKLHRAKRLKDLSDGISTRSVSTKVGTLQKVHITEAFVRALKDESKALGLKRVDPGLAPKTDSGRITHAVTIVGATSAKPEVVFSEGERTALALAYFLVDIGTPAETPCAIFDDPVTSLDHRIRTNVVYRLCKLSTDRQVVVFTHDLPFFCELKEKATHAGIPLEIRSIETMGTVVGMVREGIPVDAMKVKDRESLLQEILRAAKQAETTGDTASFASHAYRFYSRLRSTWERAVEEVLFNQVVQRFEKEVRTMSLTGVVVDSTAIAAIFDAMTKCSGLIDGHDHAVALNANTPDSEEMSADLNALTKFRTDHAAKRKAQEAELVHLKA